MTSLICPITTIEECLKSIHESALCIADGDAQPITILPTGLVMDIVQVLELLVIPEEGTA